MGTDRIYDLEASKAARDKAMAQVDGNASPDWKDLADHAIDHTARLHHILSSDNVWYTLDEWEIPRPHEARAMGPRMVAAVKRGTITPSPLFRPSSRPELHASPRRLYSSNLRKKTDG